MSIQSERFASQVIFARLPRRARRLRFGASIVLLALVASACAELSGETKETTPPVGVTCNPGAGPSTPELCCAPGEATIDNEVCMTAGIQTCAAGFEGTSQKSCAAVLPAEPCPEGQKAVPGDMECTSVMPASCEGWFARKDCQLYVKGSTEEYMPTGGMDAPFKTIAEAIAAAKPNHRICVFPGKYQGDLVIDEEPVQILGCRATIEGDSPLTAAVWIGPNGAGSVIEGFEIRGPGQGVLAEGTSATLDSLWVHDIPGHCVAAREAPDFVVRDSLVEGCGGFGVHFDESTGSVSGSVVRGTAKDEAQEGYAAILLHAESTSTRVEVEGTVVEGSEGAGLAVDGTSATLAVSSSVVRRSGGRLSNWPAMGAIYAELGANLSVADTVFEDIDNAGIYVNNGGELEVTRTTVRNVDEGDVEGSGHGIRISGASAASVDFSVVTGARRVGISIESAKQVQLVGCITSDTKEGEGKKLGDGVTIWSGRVDIQGLVTRENDGAGITVMDGDVSVRAMKSSCNKIPMSFEPPAEVVNLSPSLCGCDDPESKCACKEPMKDCGSLATGGFTPPGK